MGPQNQMINVRKKKIAYIFNHAIFLGGGEISFFELIRCIDKARTDPLAIVPAAGSVADKLELLGVQVRICPFAPLKFGGSAKVLATLLNLIRILRKFRIDLIHANGSRVGLYAGLAGRILGIPVLWHVREALCDHYLYDGLLGRLASAIVCVSTGAKLKRFNRFNAGIRRKIAVVYNGIDTVQFKIDAERRSAAREKYGFKPNEIVFGLVGNLIARKRQDFFIRGLAVARSRQPAAALKGLLIGHRPDANYSAALLALIKELNLDQNVVCCDYAPAVIDVYAALDVFVLPSRSEGLSRALLEAMSCGLPVIVSNIAEMTEAVAELKNGILVDWDDVDELAAAMLRFAADDRRRRRVGRTNRATIKRRFGLSAHVAEIESIYAKFIKDKDAGLHGPASA